MGSKIPAPGRLARMRRGARTPTPYFFGVCVSKKRNPLDGLVTGRGRYVLNQKMSIFGDRRTKRNRSRSDKKRQAIQRNQEES